MSTWFRNHRHLSSQINGSIQSATVTLSSADILDLHNTPVTLVTAPGAGKFLVPHEMVVGIAYGSVAYTYVGDITVDWEGSLATTNWPADAVYGTEDCFSTGRVVLAPQPLSLALVTNKALRLSGGPTTDGDSPVTVTTYYTVEDVPA